MPSNARKTALREKKEEDADGERADEGDDEGGIGLNEDGPCHVEEEEVEGGAVGGEGREDEEGEGGEGGEGLEGAPEDVEGLENEAGGFVPDGGFAGEEGDVVHCCAAATVPALLVSLEGRCLALSRAGGGAWGGSREAGRIRREGGPTPE